MSSVVSQPTMFDSVDQLLSNLKSTEFGSADNSMNSCASLFGSRSWAYLPGGSVSFFNSLQSFPSLTLADIHLSRTLEFPPESSIARSAANDKKSWESLFVNELTASQPLSFVTHALPELQRSSATANSTTRTEKVQEAATAAVKATQPKSGRRKRNYKGRKIVPKDKTYVDGYKEADILCGRGGRTNHHPGNQVYLKLVEQNKPSYRGSTALEKRAVVLQMLETIREQGGRFLDLDKQTGRWYIIHEKTAYNKCSQALRDNNDEATRAAKRAKYGPSRK